MQFEQGLIRLYDLLREIGWPTTITWVQHDQVLYMPTIRTIVFRPEPDGEAERRARSIFQQRYALAPAILFYAVGYLGDSSFALVEAVEELAQGEQMFVVDGLEIAARNQGERTEVTNSRLRWWLQRKLHHQWRLSTVHALAGG